MDQNFWVGVAASAFTTLAALPQLIKIFKERRAENISLLWILILIVGLCGWVTYGFLKKDLIILISNSIGIFINLAIAIYAVKFKKSA